MWALDASRPASMSDNPPLTPDRQPAPIHNEYFVLSRHGIYFSARSGRHAASAPLKLAYKFSTAAAESPLVTLGRTASRCLLSMCCNDHIFGYAKGHAVAAHLKEVDCAAAPHFYNL
eukprot:6203215-Pleurochrysis_carterae.AAC.2